MPLNLTKFLPVALVILPDSISILAPGFPKEIRDELEKISDTFGIFGRAGFITAKFFESHLDVGEEREGIFELLDLFCYEHLEWSREEDHCSCVPCCYIKFAEPPFVIPPSLLVEEIKRFFLEDHGISCLVHYAEAPIIKEEQEDE